ncbi:MAG: hypothetical protein K6E50_05150 [Lachnospiraceae bacterium]|nr:hypothetical protein [Lachnospiraceae bacterium]
MAKEEMLNTEQTDPLVPGTYQIRRIASRQNTMEMLATAEHLAAGGYEKKLFGVLSRVYTEHKGFHYEMQEGIEPLLASIVASDMPSELKMQTFTSFEIPRELKPDCSVAKKWVEECAPKRANIAAYFVASYEYGSELYPLIAKDRSQMKIFAEASAPDALLETFEAIMEKESKEYITGVIRSVKSVNRHMRYADASIPKRVTAKVFSSKEVFFTSKILFCLAFSIPADCLPGGKEMYKILKICANYEEKTTRDFVKRYHLEFDLSEAAMCRYFLGNKKSDKERALVERFAEHVVLVEQDEQKRKLLHGAFKRGGLFRMYAGCMQDGKVDVEKQKRFHYSDEQIEWVKSLPGLRE